MEELSNKELNTKIDRRIALKDGTKSFMNDFFSFIIQGNAMDLAIGFILGAGFTGVIQSFVKNIVLPPIGRVLGNVDFSSLYLNLSDKSYSTLKDAEAAGAPLLKYGLFLNDLLNFMILALVVFLVLRVVFRNYLEQKISKDKEKKK